MRLAVVNVTKMASSPEKMLTLTIKETEWNRLRENLQRNEAQAAALDAAVAKRQAMKEKSEKLQKTWKNMGGVSFKKTRQQKLDAREADKEKELQEIRRLREEERREYLTVCSRLMFYTNDGVKSLNRALVFSETLREREEQLRFEEKLKAIEDAREAAYAAHVKQNAEDFERDTYEERKSKEMRTKEYQNTILKQVKEEHDKRAADKERDIKFETEVSEKFNKDLELSAQNERENLAKRRADLRKSVLDNLYNDRAHKEMKRLEEEQENKMMSVYSAAKQKIAQQCKIREKELQQEVVRRRQEILEKLSAELKALRDNENENIRKAIERRRVADEKAQLEREVYKKKMVSEILEDERKYIEAKETNRTKAKQNKKWSVLQRYETENVSEQFARRREEKRREAMMAMRIELNRQMKEKDARLAEERKEDIEAFEAKEALMRAEDKAFLKYATQVVEESKEKGRPVMPIERAVHSYKVYHGLIPKKKINPSMTSTIPFGRAFVQPE